MSTEAARTASHAGSTPSPWVARWTHLIGAGSCVLDVACGSGRHTHWFAGHGCAVTAIDRDADAVAPLRAIAEVIVADLEHAPWPLPGRRFDGVVVTNYLWRPLVPRLVDALADGGVLICETFAIDQASIGKPSKPDFLLGRAELPELFLGLRVVAFEDGFVDTPDRFVQRIVAVREVPGGSPPRRYPLRTGPGAVAG